MRLKGFSAALASVAVAFLGCSSMDVRDASPASSRADDRNGWAAEGTGPHPALRAVPEPDRFDAPGQTIAPSQAPRLRAGDLDDNDRFDEYLRYRAEVAGRVQGRVQPIDVSERVVVHVVDATGHAASGARVIVRDLSGRALARRTACADGRTLFFPRAEAPETSEWVLEATLGPARARSVVRRGVEAVTLELDGEREAGRPALDVVFCLDCTGSMGDEIDALKRTIDDVSRRLGSLPGSPPVRLGLVKYRDRGDAFVTEIDDLTPSLGTFRRALARAEADGGGDYPEDVQAGLALAVDGSAWSTSGDTARLVFLVGDAPPHLYPDEPSYAATLRHATDKGVKCCALAASGLDDAGEFVWRQVAETTLGRFMFLSYGTPDGSRGTPHHTGPYLEKSLEDVIVSQCAREIEALGR
jgi:hypothetical protein